MKLNLIYSFFILCIMASCSQEKHQTIIKGNIPNLPDGTLYLFQETPDNKIDSIKTKNGIFNITHQWEENSLPTYLGINHVDNNGVIRFISFPSNAKFRDSELNQSTFFSDPIINITGKIIDDTPTNIGLAENIKMFITASPIIAGQQTEAFYHIDGDLFDDVGKATADKINLIKSKILEYPYSYHLLYEIEKNKNSYSEDQVKDFLQSFKGKITKSDSYKKLWTYNEKRFTRKNITVTLLEDINGNKSKILDPKYKKHLIIFWASWCGPCREEIPLLKEMYTQNNNSVEFISISIDSEENAWKKALGEEKMSWKQFIINEKNPSYENIQILFKLNGAIPYSILVDNNMKILASSTGLSSKEELQKLIKTDK